MAHLNDLHDPLQKQEEEALAELTALRAEAGRLRRQRAELAHLWNEEVKRAEILEAALRKAQPCILALRDTQRAMCHDYVCDDVVDMVAAALRDEEEKEESDVKQEG